MKKISENEARFIIVTATGSDIAPICVAGQNTYGSPVHFFDDNGNVVIKDSGCETVWEYDLAGKWLRHRGYGSSMWIGHMRL